MDVSPSKLMKEGECVKETAALEQIGQLYAWWPVCCT